MKHTLLLFFVLLTFTGLQAQGEVYFVEETNVLLGIQASDPEGVGYNHVVSTFPSTSILRWTANIIDKTGGPEPTEGWQLSVCDRNLCYEPGTTTETFAAVPDSMNTMDVHMRTNGMDGFAIIEIVITDENNPDVSVSHTYYFNTEPSNTEEIDRQAINVYPNPVQNGLFSIDGIEQATGIEVFNLTGQRVKTFTYNPGRWYNVEELPRGTYLVRLVDGQSQELVTKLLYKL
jgi:hypothetical protein